MIFKKLRIKIRIQIILPLLISLLLAITAIIAVMTHSLLTTFINDSKQHIKQKQNNIKLFFNLIEETSMQFTDESTFEGNVLNLDLIQQMNKNILGAAYIENNGNIYVSSRTSGYPDRNSIISVPSVESFLLGKEDYTWFLRKEKTADYYNNRHFDSNKGVLTFIRREDKGFLIIDVNPDAITDIIDGTNDNRFSNSVLVWNNELLFQKNLENNINDEMSTIIKNLSGNNIDFIWKTENNTALFSIPIYNKMYATVEVSYNYVVNSIISLLIPLAGILVFLIILAVLCSIILTKTIINPLEKLYHKMQQEELTTVETE